ncbi:Metallo-dependent hydrolase [Rhizodiscina lignyota]|uniref:Metallo-dependent hydrolase n=1 Tax=Rhizodiscina lignyota TaxID=1504668 RepID=A0A9P4MCJ3_9PEZI|nr:Metallo-dependent hydrolase [Rhizodiscina lignyota]
MGSSWLFRNATVVSIDEKIGTVKNCDVLVQDSIISEVAPNISAPSDDTVIIDATNAILSPGFVDTHRHTWQTQLRTVTGDFTLTDYAIHIRNRYGSCYTPEDVYLANLCGALESLDAGTTCLLDHCHILNSPAHADAAVDGLRASRIRGTFCYGLYGNPVFSDPKISDGTALVTDNQDWRHDDARRIREEKFQSNKAEDLLRFGFAPTEVERTPLEQTLNEIQLGRSLGAAIVTGHIAMGSYDRELHLVRILAERKLLGPDLVFSHGAALLEDELKAIKEAGAAISSTPDTELQMGMGQPIAFEAEKHGCTASIGIDITSNNPADMFGQMRLMLQQKRYSEVGSAPPPPRKVAARCEDVLRMATLGGAKALGLSHLTGSITPGKRADLVLTRCDSLRLTPVHDPAIALVLYANASDVDTVLVDGVPVKRDGKLAPTERTVEEVRREYNGSSEIDP